jgi:hypothetical protein
MRPFRPLVSALEAPGRSSGRNQQLTQPFYDFAIPRFRRSPRFGSEAQRVGRTCPGRWLAEWLALWVAFMSSQESKC